MELDFELTYDGDTVYLYGFPVAKIIHETDANGGAPSSVRAQFIDIIDDLSMDGTIECPECGEPL